LDRSALAGGAHHDLQLAVGIIFVLGCSDWRISSPGSSLTRRPPRNGLLTVRVTQRICEVLCLDRLVASLTRSGRAEHRSRGRGVCRSAAQDNTTRMTNLLQPSSDTVSGLGRALSDLGLAGLLGGQLFGRLALHPAVAAISEPRERGKVVNAAWQRYGLVNGVGLAAVTAGWLSARGGELRNRNLIGRERALARVKDGLVGVLVLNGLLVAVEGVRFSREAPHGAVPLRDGDHTTSQASETARRRKRRLNILGVTTIATAIGVVTVNAALDQVSFRHAPLRRRLNRFR
jgi:hypothetical protein